MDKQLVEVITVGDRITETILVKPGLVPVSGNKTIMVHRRVIMPVTYEFNGTTWQERVFHVDKAIEAPTRAGRVWKWIRRVILRRPSLPPMRVFDPGKS